MWRLALESHRRLIVDVEAMGEWRSAVAMADSCAQIGVFVWQF